MKYGLEKTFPEAQRPNMQATEFATQRQREEEMTKRTEIEARTKQAEMEARTKQAEIEARTKQAEIEAHPKKKWMDKTNLSCDAESCCHQSFMISNTDAVFIF